MRNKLLAVTLMLFTLACANNNNVKKVESNEETQPKSIGGSKDEHGCLVGAGQTWSKLAQSCIQVFKEAKRLNPIHQKENEAVISAFALMNEDASKCEIFLPYGDVSSIILSQTGDKNYSEGDYRYDLNNATLYIKNEAAYKAD